ncbi:MAG: replication restart helicase PriA, partial [Thermacetogeniaceae bacterium]
MGERCAEVTVDINHPLLDHFFYYRIPSHVPEPEIGTKVIVPFGSLVVNGWIIGYSEPPNGIQLKEIISVCPDPSLTPELLEIGRWMAEHYVQPLAEILRVMAPPPKPSRAVKTQERQWSCNLRRSTISALTPEQERAVEEIVAGLRRGSFQQFLLHGVTGGGKTEVYLRAAACAVSLDRQVLYLIPEIALTPQAEAWFRSALGDQVAIWHSRQGQSEKYHIYEGIRTGKIKVLIGPRSAVFAPFKKLGLIIIDEEHDPSYKSQEQPYYHAREVAYQRARYHQAVLLLGSATPSVESFARALKGHFSMLTIKQRPPGRSLPRVTLVDMRCERRREGAGILSSYLCEQITLRLERKEQVILFLNRRGYAPLVFCSKCGHVLRCQHCSISLVYHRSSQSLQCHYCNYKTRLPERCPKCMAPKNLSMLGAGIQRVEQELQGLYPNARIQRFDLDTTRRKGAFRRILEEFARGEIDILLGTQMVTKGHDFPRVTLVGVLNADLALNLPDYRAAERTYQLLAQVAGRAGRGQLSGEVVVQTYFPDHYSIVAACKNDYAMFFKEEANWRRYLGYPPFA